MPKRVAMGTNLGLLGWELAGEEEYGPGRKEEAGAYP